MISKNSSTKASSRSAFVEGHAGVALPRGLGQIGVVAQSSKYPITEVSGVLTSCARYATSSFFRTSAACAARSSAKERSRTAVSSARTMDRSSPSPTGADPFAIKPPTADESSSKYSRDRRSTSTTMITKPAV